MGVPKLPKLGLPWLWGPITLRANLRLKLGLKQRTSSRAFQRCVTHHLHATYMQENRVDFQLLVVRSQIANLTFDPSFGHNLCFRCLNGSCEPILNIYVRRAFQWYKELLNLLSFDPYNRPLKIQKSIEIPTPKVETPLGVWGSDPSHSLTLSRTCGVIPGLPFWLTTLQALALVASPRLGLRH